MNTRDSLQCFQTVWMIILGSSVCKEQKASRERLFLKHAAISADQNQAQNRLERESWCIFKISESTWNHFLIHNALIYFPSPSLQWCSQSVVTNQTNSVSFHGFIRQLKNMCTESARCTKGRNESKQLYSQFKGTDPKKAVFY